MLTTILLFFSLQSDSLLTALLTRADYYFYLQPDSTIAISRRAIDLAGRTGNQKALATAHNSLGFGYLQLGMNTLAHDQFLKAYPIYTGLADTGGLSHTVNYIANAFHNQKRYREALRFFHESRRLNQLAGITQFNGRELGNIGICYQELGVHDSALLFIRAAINDYISEQRPGNQAIFEIYLGKSLAATGKVDSALQMTVKGLTGLTHEPSRLKFRAKGHLLLAGIYLEKGQLTSASRHLDSAAAVLFPRRFRNEMLDWYQLALKKSVAEKNWKSAVSFQTQIQALSDSLRNDDLARLQSEFQHQLDLKLRETEIRYLTTQADIQRKITFWLVSGLILLSLLSAGLVLLFIRNRRQKRLLAQSNAELIATNQQLTEALENVRELKGLIPICANCKKIRDDSGFWNRIESYLMKHTHAEFTHGICPACTELLYGDLTRHTDPPDSP